MSMINPLTREILVNTIQPRKIPDPYEQSKKISEGIGNFARGLMGKPPATPQSHRLGKTVGEIFKKKKKSMVHY